MRTALLVLTSIVLFLAAAKAHGRELRLEREAAGVSHVDFGRRNPPVVEAIWRAERIRFWIATPIFALAFVVACWRLGASHAISALAIVAWSPSCAFVVLGFASARRVGGMSAAGVGWWAIVAVAVIAVALCAGFAPRG